MGLCSTSAAVPAPPAVLMRFAPAQPLCQAPEQDRNAGTPPGFLLGVSAGTGASIRPIFILWVAEMLIASLSSSASILAGKRVGVAGPR